MWASGMLVKVRYHNGLVDQFVSVDNETSQLVLTPNVEEAYAFRYIFDASSAATADKRDGLLSNEAFTSPYSVSQIGYDDDGHLTLNHPLEFTGAFLSQTQPDTCSPITPDAKCPACSVMGYDCLLANETKLRGMLLEQSDLTSCAVRYEFGYWAVSNNRLTHDTSPTPAFSFKITP